MRLDHIAVPVPGTGPMDVEVDPPFPVGLPGDQREVAPTRSHPEHESETPLRRWYCGLSVGE